MPKEHQIGCYMTAREAADLCRLARVNELTRAKLLILLVLRELRTKRLRSLAPHHPERIGKGRGKRITARTARASVKLRFKRHAAECGLGIDEAAGVIFRAELRERWLMGALRAGGNRP
jgi:hypothetical protein